MAMYSLYTDGASRGNPGPSGVGGVLFKDDVVAYRYAAYIGDKRTNNEAEYEALLYGLRIAQNLEITKLKVFADSKLVVSQVVAGWKINVPHLRKLNQLAKNMVKQFESFEMQHILRGFNKKADAMSNIGIDGREKHAFNEQPLKPLQDAIGFNSIPILPNLFFELDRD